MRQKMTLFVLFISLAFNIGFLIMFAYTKSNTEELFTRPPSERSPRMHSIFNDEALQTARQENRELKKSFFLELAKPEIDSETIEDLVQRLEVSQRDLEKDILRHFIKVRAESTPEEAETIFGEYHKRYSEGRDRGHRRGNAENQRRGETK